MVSCQIYVLASSINIIFHDPPRSRSSSDRRKHRDSDSSEDIDSPPKMKNDKHRNSEKNGHPRERSDYNDDKRKEIRKHRTYSRSPERNTKRHDYNNSSERRPHKVQQSSRSPKRNSSRRKSRSRSPRKKQEDHRTFENHSNEGRYRKETEEDWRHNDKRHRSRTPSPSPRKHDSKIRSYARTKSPPETNVSRFVLISTMLNIFYCPNDDEINFLFQFNHFKHLSPFK